MFFFSVWAGACFIFCCLGRGAGPAQTAKKNTPPPKQKKKKKKKKNGPPLPSVLLFLLFGRVGVLFFWLFGRGDVFFFLLFGPVACYVFAVWAGVVFFFAVWAGDGSSLTYPSAWLVFKRPNNKRDQTAKKKKRGFPKLGFQYRA